MVDIIVPIYNAYEDLTKCIASIWRNTDLKSNRLLLINDKSTDERILPYLENIMGGNIVVHNSEMNGGFSASVNIGMRYSQENDVVLLNSDTIVTSRWLEKMGECAYTENNIATVTPLSNSATIASIPIIGQDNAIPNNITIDQYADIIEKCSFRHYPQITVAVGFCMYIKRRVLNEIGYFDEKTFGEGYGEENDFCCRAEMMGYKHVLCDDTFIYHKGTASFKDEQKQRLREEHVRVLESRYLGSMRNNHIFCMSKPFQYIRDNIEIYVKLFNGKKNILYILHSDFRKDAVDNIGGTQLHVKDLMEQLTDKYNIYVLTKYANNYRLSGYVDSELYTFVFKNDNINYYPLFRDARQGIILENILAAFRIDLIHVHHISGIMLEIYYVSDKMDIPIVTSIHDYYTLCPAYSLYNIYEQECEGCDIELCGKCLEKRVNIWNGNANYMEKWRLEMYNAMQYNKVLFFPSVSTQQAFERIYPVDAVMKVIGHGVDKTNRAVETIKKYNKERERIRYRIERVNLLNENVVDGWVFLEGMENEDTGVVVQLIQHGQIISQTEARKYERRDVDNAFGGVGRYVHSGFQTRVIKNLIRGKKVDIRILLTKGEEVYLVKELKRVSIRQENVGEGIRAAFIGGMSEIKGCRIASEMIKHAPDIEWYIFGNIDIHEELYRLERNNLHKFGFYNRNDIEMILKLNQIDVVCIMSRCPETFCYTLSEALNARIPVLAYDIGAVGERLKETRTGVLVSASAGIDEILQKIRTVPEGDEWKLAKEHLEKYEHKTTLEMANEYASVYESIFQKGEKKSYYWDAEMLKEAFCKKEKRNRP